MRRLEAAGYANVGKTNLHEFAYGTTSENEHFGPVPNPRYPGPDRGRLERRLRGGARGRARRRRARLRLRRLDPDPRGLLRRDRLQADLGARPDRGLLPARAELRPRRADGARRRGLRADAAGARARLRADARSSSRTSRSASRGPSSPTRSSAPGSRPRPSCFPHRRRLELPLADGFYDCFSREVADVHRELFAEHADSYGENVRPKIEWCLAVTDAEYERARERRERYREQLAEAAAGVDLVLTPTLLCVAPPRAGRRARAARPPDQADLPVQRHGLAGGGASPAGPQRTVCPPRRSSRLRPARTPSCSARPRRSSAR